MAEDTLLLETIVTSDGTLTLKRSLLSKNMFEVADIICISFLTQLQRMVTKFKAKENMLEEILAD